MTLNVGKQYFPTLGLIINYYSIRSNIYKESLPNWVKSFKSLVKLTFLGPHLPYKRGQLTCELIYMLILFTYRVTKKNMPIVFFFREIIQPNLPKFAYNLIWRRRVRIWSQILTISIPGVPKSRSKFSKNGKNRFIRFSSFSGWVK